MCEALPICFGGLRLLLFNVLNEFPHTMNMERSLKRMGGQSQIAWNGRSGAFALWMGIISGITWTCALLDR